MAKFYLIRHGEPDYTYGDSHGYIGQGHDFAPLKTEKIKEVVETSKDKRLKEAQIIIASPYTRALQTASIISKETGIDIVVEPDIREWQPDLTYQYKRSRGDEAILQRNITQSDVEYALLNGEIIEEYEDFYPYPSCLVYGINLDNKVLHIVCGSNEEELWIITAYYPDNTEWQNDLKTRKEIK